MSVPPSPEYIATLTLTVGGLELHLRTKHITVWRVRDGRLAPVYGLWDPDGGQPALARRLWKRHATELRAGRTVRGADGTLVPLMDAELVGFLHVVGEQPVPPAVLPIVHTACASLARTLVRTEHDTSRHVDLSAPVAQPAETALARFVAEEQAEQRRAAAKERARILYMLDANGWNVAETARSLGWSRGKLSQRMEQHGLERPTPAPTDPRRRRGDTSAEPESDSASN